MGRGSSTVSSALDCLFSSSMSWMDGCRKSTELMVCTGDDAPDDLDDVVVEADEGRRRDVRTLPGAKRERIIWKRVDGMLKVCMLKMI